MGLFSFGGSEQRSRSSGRSQSSSEAFSEQSSQAGSVSGGSSTSRSQTGAVGASEQAIAFEDVFARLYGGAENVAANLDPSLLTDAANQLFSGGTEFLNRIGGDVGTQFLEDRLVGDNALLEEQIALLGEDLGRFFEEEINPVIRSDAISAGQLGGGREGVALGRASSALTEQFRRGATDLRARDLTARDAIASSIADRTIAGAGAAVSAIPSLAGAAQLGFGAGIAPAERLAAILGDPTVLTTSGQRSFGTSFADASDFAESFSESFGTSASRSQSTAEQTARSRGRSLSLGFI